MRISLSTVAAIAFFAATVTAHAQAPRENSLQDRAPQPGVQRPADPSAVRAPSVAPSRETTGAAAPGEPRDPVPAGGKHDEEDQTAPTSTPAPK
jgi:hypothetical protein